MNLRQWFYRNVGLITLECLIAKLTSLYCPLSDPPTHCQGLVQSWVIFWYNRHSTFYYPLNHWLERKSCSYLTHFSQLPGNTKILSYIPFLYWQKCSSEPIRMIGSLETDICKKKKMSCVKYNDPIICMPLTENKLCASFKVDTAQVFWFLLSCPRRWSEGKKSK